MAGQDGHGRSRDRDAVPVTSLLVLGLADKLRRQLEGELAPLGLSMRRYSTLGHIAGSPGMSYSELARRAGVTVQTTFKLVRTLEDEGLVTQQQRGPARGSPVGLALTSPGREALAQARRAAGRVDARVFRALTQDDVATLTVVLGRVVQDAGQPPGPGVARDAGPATGEDVGGPDGRAGAAAG